VLLHNVYVRNKDSNIDVAGALRIFIGNPSARARATELRLPFPGELRNWRVGNLRNICIAQSAISIRSHVRATRALVAQRGSRESRFSRLRSSFAARHVAKIPRRVPSAIFGDLETLVRWIDRSIDSLILARLTHIPRRRRRPFN